jgi:CheY-like chemotaxis protein
MKSKKLPQSDLTVWAIDDDEINLDIMRDLLDQLGVTSVQAMSHSRKAMGLLETTTNPPDVIILDIYMPDMDGIEFMTELAKRQFAGGLILVSGVNIEMLDLARQLATESGMNVLAAMEKPIQLSELARAMGLDL